MTHPPDDDWEPDAADDLPDEDDAQTVPCPYCGREIYEDAQRCPHCGRYISQEDAPPGRKPVWLVLTAVVCVVIVVLWILNR